MSVLEVGRVCIKTAGREAGKLCVVVKDVDDSFVLVTGPKSMTRVKRRKCNIAHLEPLEVKLPIKSDAPDSEVEAELKKTDVLKKYALPLFAGHHREVPRGYIPKHAEKKHVEETHEEKPKKEPKEEKPAEKKKTEHKEKPKTAAKPAAKKVTKKPAAKKPTIKKPAEKKATKKPASKK